MKAVWLLIGLLLSVEGIADEALPYTIVQTTAGTDGNPDGEVRVPLSVYQHLWQLQQVDVRPAPASHAVGTSSVHVEVFDPEDESSTRVGASAQVRTTLVVEVFEDQWTLVPVLPAGAALQSATVDGQPAQLVQTSDGLAWSTSEAGRYRMQLNYGVDARRSESGYVLPLPVPVAAATELTLSFPGTGLDLAVLPAANQNIVEAGGRTTVTASVPATSGILVSWRVPLLSDYAISRARYVGELVKDAIVWEGELQVEAFSGKPLTIPLLPTSVTLADVGVDGETATVLEKDGRFATMLQGRGSHTVSVRFQTTVIQTDGPPRVEVDIPKVPVSQLELKLPGRKQVTVVPAANVVTDERDDTTLATVFVPMTERVTLRWLDAVPEDARTGARANAVVYHAVHAEEGVLQIAGTVVYDITHGETSTLILALPADAEVNRITAPGGGVSDWTETASEDGATKIITVFLDRQVRGEFTLSVLYERLLGPDAAGMAQDIDVPLLFGRELHRQRGMVALLIGSELSLNPTAETDITRVGENQLPAFIRNSLNRRVAHTYKYVGPTPALTVEAVAPERAQGKFDAQVDTLVSIGEVTLKGAASVAIDVKSGAIMILDLLLPGNLNILGVTGPSLRSHDVTEDEGGQRIKLAFTQEMTGQFRIEVNYERILTDSDADPVVPALHVAGAEVEHGRIAIEALTAVEVQALVAEQLTALEVGDLPQQMILKTTNPILLAFKYVQTTPPARLQLEITRHDQIDVQVAAVEEAAYTTLFTRDGLAITTASLAVRNSRRQFLRLQLPVESDLWSVFVDGKPAKPARTGDGNTVLIRMINSANAFPVEIVYATPVNALGVFGTVDLSLPRPDMVVTHTRWDLFLPQGPDYRTPNSNMDVLLPGRPVSPEVAARQTLQRTADALESYGQPLRIDVPRRGVHFAFEKLYATQAPENPRVRIGYISASGHQWGALLGLVGVVLLWAGIFALGATEIRVPRRTAFAGIGAGGVMVLVATGPLGASVTMVAVIALVLATGYAGYRWMPHFRAWQATRATG